MPGGAQHGRGRAWMLTRLIDDYERQCVERPR